MNDEIAIEKALIRAIFPPQFEQNYGPCFWWILRGSIAVTYVDGRWEIYEEDLAWQPRSFAQILAILRDPKFRRRHGLLEIPE